MNDKHEVLQVILNSGSNFYNYKLAMSIGLFALLNADSLFGDVRCKG
jgi:hypothetical protein